MGQENNADPKFIAKAWNRMGRTHDGNGLWDEVRSHHNLSNLHLVCICMFVCFLYILKC